MRVKKPRQPIDVVCIDCGKVFVAYSKAALRCPECREKAKKKTSAEWMANDRAKNNKKSNKTYPKLNLRETMAAMEKYNKAHNTHLSYGKFVSLLEGGKLDG